MRIKHILLLAILAFNSSAPAMAGEFSGYIAAESKLFFNDPLYPEQDKHGASLAFNIEYYHDFEQTDGRMAFTGFARQNSNDNERSHSDIRELYYWQGFDEFELYAGIRRVFWGVTETVHLMDVINQTDAVENLDGEDKLGQPMISLVTDQDWGTLEAYVLPGFRERTFTGINGRLRPRYVIDPSDALYESERKENHIDFALRWSTVIGDWDLGVSHFSGTSRDPVFVPDTQSHQDVRLRPFYEQVEQTGLDLQATLGDWAWKLEALSIKQKDSGRKTAFVGGFEYTLFGIADSVADLGLLAEYQFDDRDQHRHSVNQNDMAVGMRLALNDVDDSELLMAASRDFDDQSLFYSVEASTRLSGFWSMALEARFFSNTSRDSSSFDLRDDDYLQLEIKRYF